MPNVSAAAFPFMSPIARWWGTSDTRSVTTIGTGWWQAQRCSTASGNCSETNDERADYAESLRNYYQSGPDPNWRERFVSAYASMHPWEDFAETWAHYLHLVDTTEMAAAFDLHLDPRIDRTGGLEANVNFNPYRARNFQNVIDNWLPMAFAMNNINRCM